MLYTSNDAGKVDVLYLASIESEKKEQLVAEALTTILALRDRVNELGETASRFFQETLLEIAYGKYKQDEEMKHEVDR